jgi:hypothetical protein
MAEQGCAVGFFAPFYNMTECLPCPIGLRCSASVFSVFLCRSYLFSSSIATETQEPVKEKLLLPVALLAPWGPTLLRPLPMNARFAPFSSLFLSTSSPFCCSSIRYCVLFLLLLFLCSFVPSVPVSLAV